MPSLSELVGGNPLFTPVFVSTSTTYTIPISGVYRIGVMGAGGGAGGVSAAGGGAATGGGGGGFAESEVALNANTALTITIGAGGQSAASNSTNSAGTSGGTTSVVGGPVNISVQGGGGGSFSIAAGTVSGSMGGSATGGNICNYTGGASGSVVYTASYLLGSGGGSSASPMGNGYSSGGISGVATLSGGTGGGGVGGSSAAVINLNSYYNAGGPSHFISASGLSSYINLSPTLSDLSGTSVGFANPLGNRVAMPNGSHPLSGYFFTINNPFRSLLGTQVMSTSAIRNGIGPSWATTSTPLISFASFAGAGAHAGVNQLTVATNFYPAFSYIGGGNGAYVIEGGTVLPNYMSMMPRFGGGAGATMGGSGVGASAGVYAGQGLVVIERIA